MNIGYLDSSGLRAMILLEPDSAGKASSSPSCEVPHWSILSLWRRLSILAK